MIVLGCETSCDETGLAVYDTNVGLRAHALYSQADLHALYGGVVPELASRDHIRRLLPLMRHVLADAQLDTHELDGVAYTAGPGLAGALMTGALAARALAWSLGCPALAVHHMEGHLLARCWKTMPRNFRLSACWCPVGTQCWCGSTRWEFIGFWVNPLMMRPVRPLTRQPRCWACRTRAGHAWLSWPLQGMPEAIALPRPMLDRPGLDFSFSGLKTAAITRFKASNTTPGTAAHKQFVCDLAASFEAAVVDTLLTKCKRALQQERLTRLVISGGVSANINLREAADKLCVELGGEAFYPSLEFCTDNGAMIALAGARRLLAGQSSGLEVVIRPRWPLQELSATKTV